MAVRRSRRIIGVLCSGGGTNLQAMIQAVRSGRLRGHIGVVVSDRAEAQALTRAKRAGIPSVFVDPNAFPSREAFERELIRQLESRGAELVCLAGFMRMLSPIFVRRFTPKLLNIHPALLPAFPGAHALRDALAWGAKVTGVTVHVVDEQMDHGPIVLQEAMAIRAGESFEALLARVHRLEHRLYPQAMQLLLDGRVRVRGHATTILPK